MGISLSLSAGSAKVATAAIRGWSLLLSTVPAWRMTTHSVEQSLQVTAMRNMPHYLPICTVDCGCITVTQWKAETVIGCTYVEIVTVIIRHGSEVTLPLTGPKYQTICVTLLRSGICFETLADVPFVGHTSGPSLADTGHAAETHQQTKHHALQSWPAS